MRCCGSTLRHHFLTETQIRPQGIAGLHGTQFAGLWTTVNLFLVFGKVYKDKVLNKFEIRKNNILDLGREDPNSETGGNTG
jgi:hypothetical protein